ncbi:MAG: O-linked N-acetylglucosamine transferase, SPINDLY family protein [Oculatellaceae cyanobacterium Prado106]|jgi:predicted O-linked N-acetylglucosamine transferase (SPINDLY family)|nr:O-linked N-acetylglucosamine transferase, SPINDLY family protein [Oculatellaceae cyanobacterium Prado106]
MQTQQTVNANATVLLSEQAETALRNRRYVQASELYEELVTLEPEHILHYWRLGLTRLFLGEEAEAQLTWMTILAEATPAQSDEWVQSLITVLKTEASRLDANVLDPNAEEGAIADDTRLAWTVRQYIREIAPDDLDNLLHLILLSIRLKQFEGNNLLDWGIISLLESQVDLSSLDLPWLLQVTAQAIEDWFEDPLVIQFADLCLRRINNPPLIAALFLEKAQHFSRFYTVRDDALATCYLEYCLQYDPGNAAALRDLSRLYFTGGKFTEAIELSRRFYAICEGIGPQIMGIAVLISRLLRTGSYWEEAWALFSQQQTMIQQFLAEYEPHKGTPLEPAIVCGSFFNFPYFEDKPAESRSLQNKMAKVYQEDLHYQAQEYIEPFKGRYSVPKNKKDKIKIAYISSCLRQHSVGWLSRWLFNYHSHDRFEIYTYHIDQKYQEGSFTDMWFVKNADHSATFDGTPLGIAQHINEQDEIDILVDLDSITHGSTFGIMAFKPAPVQVSWLGFDATGLPAVDYFVADPYVLPDNAQDYYSEKIWRLSQTYVAVDGFEVGVPTLRREHLAIPSDAVIYLTTQQGQKLHPETIRIQFKILQEVPNSYLLIKSRADNLLLKKTFEEVAEAEGIACDRLKFLSGTANEYIHRANLQIADVVLDTFPYNGATTTLETLWMGIPIVTKAGQQFSARNSYAFMMNVGISEGIAWTDEEYIEWGVRLGKDVNLRQHVRGRLWQSRQISPLWNAKQFTLEMEKAYEQMWQLSQEGVS